LSPGDCAALNLAQEYSAPVATGSTTVAATDIERAILRTLAYSDLFDYPLTVDEIWRYQAGTDFPLERVADTLACSPDLRSRVSRDGPFYCLSGREETFAIRSERIEASEPVWRRARMYGRVLSRLPFVRMVAVTGALAMDNLGDRPDIDLLVVTEAGRVWVCRRLIVGLVRLARLAGDDLCPNYIIADTKLDIDQRDLFTAHELAQMIPLSGVRLYRAMLERNAWAGEYLPVAFREPFALKQARSRRFIGRALERALRARLFNRWEVGEMKRLRNKLRPLIGEDAEVVCSPEQCKGHTGRHRLSITTRYAQRLADLGLPS
jgi:hypothetical protein